jgi:long-subunit fatty acid transport protein
MIKKFILSICLLFTLISVAQEGTSSPYSFYGIGDIRFRGTTDTRSMGGLSVFPDSIHLNLQNPALLASLKTTTFSISATSYRSKLKTESNSSNTARTALDYLAVGIPLGKAGLSFGLIPYSAVGYKIENVATETNPETTRFNGVGGINKAFVAVGMEVYKNLSLGVDLQYNFGKIETTSLSSISEIELSTLESNRSNGAGVSFNTGISYFTKITKKLTLFTSATFAPESKLKFTNQRKINLVQILSAGGFSTIDAANGEISVPDTTIKLPQTTSFSVAIGEQKKWSVGSEITFRNSNTYSNRFADSGSQSSFENSTRYIVGGYYIPKYNSFDNYLDRINYRLGLRYEKTGLLITDQSVDDQAITFGLGLPMNANVGSNLNIGLEYGKRGKTSYGLVQDNYFNISVGLSFNDVWFRRRKID